MHEEELPEWDDWLPVTIPMPLSKELCRPLSWRPRGRSWAEDGRLPPAPEPSSRSSDLVRAFSVDELDAVSSESSVSFQKRLQLVSDWLDEELERLRSSPATDVLQLEEEAEEEEEQKKRVTTDQLNKCVSNVQRVIFGWTSTSLEE